MGSYKFDVSFRVKHPDLDPGTICSKLNLVAKYKWKSGDLRRIPKGDLLMGTHNESYCSFRLNKESGMDLIALITSMNIKLKPHQEYL